MGAGILFSGNNTNDFTPSLSIYFDKLKLGKLTISSRKLSKTCFISFKVLIKIFLPAPHFHLRHILKIVLKFCKDSYFRY